MPTVTFDQFNKSLLNKSINLFKKKSNWSYINSLIFQNWFIENQKQMILNATTKYKYFITTS